MKSCVNCTSLALACASTSEDIQSLNLRDLSLRRSVHTSDRIERPKSVEQHALVVHANCYKAAEFADVLN